MKKSLLVCLLALLSLLFISCGGAISQDGDASLSLDTGTIIKYVAQRSENVSKAFALKPSAYYEDIDFTEFITYALVVKASTEGGYSMSTEQVYKAPVGNVQSEEEMASIFQELCRKASASPITLENIPIGKKIKVKISISMVTLVDTDAYIKALEAQGCPSYLIEEMKKVLEQEKAEMEYEVELAQGTSEPFIVKSGQNAVKIRIRVPGFTDFEEMGTFDILLYTKSDSPAGNGIWAYKMEAGRTIADYSRTKSYADDVYNMIDFVCDNNGGIYYSCLSENCYIVVYEDSQGTIETVCDDISMNQPEFTKLYVDYNKNAIFFGGHVEGNYQFGSSPLKLSSAMVTCESEYFQTDLDIRDYYDFAVSLGECEETLTPEFPEEEEQQFITYSYNNSAFYLAGKTYDYGTSAYDIVIYKIPMSYKIQEEEANVNSVITLSGNSSALRLSELYVDFPLVDGAFDYPYEVTDMYVNNGQLYVLISSSYVSAYLNSMPSFPYDFYIHSNGVMLQIDLDNFTASGVTAIGYKTSNVTQINRTIFDSENNSRLVQYKILQPNSERAKYFFNPRKFIAVKPKELVIADDGLFYYKDDTDGFCYKNVDRVVVFDEDTSELSAYALDTADVVKFEKNDTENIDFRIDGTGFDDIIFDSDTCINKE